MADEEYKIYFKAKLKEGLLSKTFTNAVYKEYEPGNKYLVKKHKSKSDAEAHAKKLNDTRSDKDKDAAFHYIAA